MVVLDCKWISAEQLLHAVNSCPGEEVLQSGGKCLQVHFTQINIRVGESTSSVGGLCSVGIVAVEWLGGCTLLLLELTVYTTFGVVEISTIRLNEVVNVMTRYSSFDFAFVFDVTDSGVRSDH
jgi:hypothetical protein